MLPVNRVNRDTPQRTHFPILSLFISFHTLSYSFILVYLRFVIFRLRLPSFHNLSHSFIFVKIRSVILHIASHSVAFCGILWYFFTFLFHLSVTHSAYFRAAFCEAENGLATVIPNTENKRLIRSARNRYEQRTRG